MSGRSAQGAPLLRTALPGLEAQPPGQGFLLALLATQNWYWTEDFERAGRSLRRLIDTARASSAPLLLPYYLAVQSELDFRLGRWPVSAAHATESIRLARDTGERGTLAFALSALARLDAARGRERACRAGANEALTLASETGVESVRVYGLSYLGLLELGMGRIKAAIDTLEEAANLITLAALREPNVVQWAPDRIEAYARTGATRQAQQALERFTQEATASGRTQGSVVP